MCFDDILLKIINRGSVNMNADGDSDPLDRNDV